MQGSGCCCCFSGIRDNRRNNSGKVVFSLHNQQILMNGVQRRLFNDTHTKSEREQSHRCAQTDRQRHRHRCCCCCWWESVYRRNREYGGPPWGIYILYSRIARINRCHGTLSSGGALTSHTKGHQCLGVIVHHIVLDAYGFHGQSVQYVPEEVLGRDERNVPL